MAFAKLPKDVGFSRRVFYNNLIQIGSKPWSNLPSTSSPPKKSLKIPTKKPNQQKPPNSPFTPPGCSSHGLFRAGEAQPGLLLGEDPPSCQLSPGPELMEVERFALRMQVFIGGVFLFGVFWKVLCFGSCNFGDGVLFGSWQNTSTLATKHHPNKPWSKAFWNPKRRQDVPSLLGAPHAWEIPSKDLDKKCKFICESIWSFFFNMLEIRKTYHPASTNTAFYTYTNLHQECVTLEAPIPLEPRPLGIHGEQGFQVILLRRRAFERLVTGWTGPFWCEITMFFPCFER